ncbi:MAG: 50S ribosomal protein L32 [Chloroflexota bacterium]|nr:50S ribosomal protein L32 [Chloroflexota bacterium]
MALPKRKYAKARQGKRRSHLKLTIPALVSCPQCHNNKPAHQVCPYCGTYNGRTILKSSTSK